MERSVTVEKIEGLPALKMTWAAGVKGRDVGAAFQQIQSYIREHRQPVYILVILADDVRMPVSGTVLQAIPVYQDRLLKEWVVVNGSLLARTVEGTLSSITNRKNVVWFDTEAEALDYITVQSSKP